MTNNNKLGLTIQRYFSNFGAGGGGCDALNMAALLKRCSSILDDTFIPKPDCLCCLRFLLLLLLLLLLHYEFLT